MHRLLGPLAFGSAHVPAARVALPHAPLPLVLPGEPRRLPPARLNNTQESSFRNSSTAQDWSEYLIATPWRSPQWHKAQRAVPPYRSPAPPKARNWCSGCLALESATPSYPPARALPSASKTRRPGAPIDGWPRQGQRKALFAIRHAPYTVQDPLGARSLDHCSWRFSIACRSRYALLLLT